jgi:hypothetical protein
LDFDGEAHQVVHAGHGGVELAKVAGQGGLGINVKRRAILAGKPFKGHLLAKQPGANVMKLMHINEIGCGHLT